MSYIGLLSQHCFDSFVTILQYGAVIPIPALGPARGTAPDWVVVAMDAAFLAIHPVPTRYTLVDVTDAAHGHTAQGMPLKIRNIRDEKNY